MPVSYTWAATLEWSWSFSFIFKWGLKCCSVLHVVLLPCLEKFGLKQRLLMWQDTELITSSLERIRTLLLAFLRPVPPSALSDGRAWLCSQLLQLGVGGPHGPQPSGLPEEPAQGELLLPRNVCSTQHFENPCVHVSELGAVPFYLVL